MNKEIKDEMDLVVKTIKESDIYINYLKLLDKVKNNCDINLLVNEIRDIEKKLVKKPSITLENKLKEKELELNSIPLYLDYKDSIDEVNNMLLIVKNKMDKFVNTLILENL